MTVHPAANLRTECAIAGWSLVVSADPATRVHLRHALTALGQVPVSVSDCVAAREELLRRGGRPMVVVIDSDTRHATSLVTGASRLRDAAVVICATRGSAAVRTAGVEADGYLAKPLELAKSIAEIRAIVRRSPAERLAIRRARRSLAAEG